MATDYDSSSAARKLSLNVVMALVFATSVALAWRYAHGITAAIEQRGADILTTIRQQGLAHFYPKKGTGDWYLRHQGGAVLGWRLVLVIRQADGTFTGLEANLSRSLRSPATFEGHWERWQLDNHATRGRYIAGSVRVGPRLWELKQDTSIDLADGAVTVVQQDAKGLARRSTGPTDENYLPEGTILLAQRLIAKRRTNAQFRLIFNELLPRGTRPRFETRTFRYLAEPSETVPGAVATVEGESALTGFMPQEAYFDEHGRLLQVITGKVRLTSAGLGQIQRYFPDVLDYVRQIHSETGFPKSPDFNASESTEESKPPPNAHGGAPGVEVN